LTTSAVDRTVRSARRRLIAQRILDRLVRGLVGGLTVGLVWFLAEPLLVTPATVGLRWMVVGGILVVVAITGVMRAVRHAPARLTAALEIDSRFALQERITTALTLSPESRSTPVGLAVLADAEAHATPLRVQEQFPVRVSRSAAWIPALAGLLAVVAFVYHPVTDSPLWAEGQNRAADPARSTNPTKPLSTTPAERKTRPDPDRPNRSPKVKALEAELDRLERLARESQREPAREKVTELTAAEDRAKALERETADRLARMEQKLRDLDKLSGSGEFEAGPVKDLNDALASGDLQKAEQAVEELAKKIREKTLDPEQAARVAKQLERMQDELQRLVRNPEQRDKLRNLIEQARKEGRDPDALQRELDRLDREADQLNDLTQLANSLRSVQTALQDATLDDAAKSLDRLADQLRGIEGEVKDLEEIRGQLQRLKAIQAAMTGGGDQPGRGVPAGGVAAGRADGVGARVDNAAGGGVASGARPENPDAQTNRGTNERQRTPFDPAGRKGYGGSVAGPSFTKKSPTELGAAINRAIQEAPDAVANQPVSRDDKEAVKEFFQAPRK
jgi:uncharacterized coiled-coil DUF342 family protein/uncharacterized membrane protein (UPF0136 family)